MLLLSKKDSSQKWEVLLRPAKRVKTGTIIHFGDGFRAEITDKVSEKKWIVDFGEIPDFDDFLKKYGNAPLPPYIKRKLKSISGFRDLERYQTIYAKNPGSVAAPTAGLHFSDDIIETLKDRGVEIVPVTLHVGYGTFLPIETETIEDHVMEKEFFEISEESAEKINRAKTVTAVGTTSVRVLESSSDQNGKVKPGKGYTDLYIYPGYRFKKAGRILTNFHLPKSSLFLLTCAFAGTELTKTAYKKAMEEGFRFYSYGDCMLVL
jgi:S-adenosylmethionine:tRNA ribosyltransferase-isomerase